MLLGRFAFGSFQHCQPEFFMRFVRRHLGFLFFLIFLLTGPLLAQSLQGASDTSAQGDRIAQLQQQIADAKGSADNAWMLVSSALVLMMTGPGLALFYGGLVRKKNVLATMMQSFAMMALITVLWASSAVQPLLRLGNQLHRRDGHAFCEAWARSLMPTTLPPSRSRRS